MVVVVTGNCRLQCLQARQQHACSLAGLERRQQPSTHISSAAFTQIGHPDKSFSKES